MIFPTWPNVECIVVTDEDFELEATADAIDAALARKPEVPPEVWNDTPIDPDRAMAAVRAMCG